MGDSDIDNAIRGAVGLHARRKRDAERIELSGGLGLLSRDEVGDSKRE